MEETLEALREAINALPPGGEKSTMLEYLADIESKADVAEAMAGIQEQVDILREDNGHTLADHCDAITEALADVVEPEIDELDFER